MSAPLLDELKHLRLSLGLGTEDVSAASGLTMIDVGRIERGDAEIRLDAVIAYAAAVGRSAVLSPGPLPRSARLPPENLSPAELAAELERLRGVFKDCRETTGLSPTAFSRIAGMLVKTVFALERGPQTPRFSTALVHAERFGLTLALSPFGEGERPDLIEACVVPALPSILSRLEESCTATSSYFEKAPRNEMEAAIERTLREEVELSGLKPRGLAQRMDVNWKTISTGGMDFSLTGRLETVAKAATVLGFRLVAVPEHFCFQHLVAGTAPVPPEDPVFNAAMPLAIGAALTKARKRSQISDRQVEKLGISPKTFANILEDPRHATLSKSCEAAAVLGMKIVCVPEAAVEDVLRGAREAKPKQTRSNSTKRTSFHPDQDAGKRALYAEFAAAVARAVGTPDPRLATRLGWHPDKVSGLLSGARYRERLSDVIDFLRATGTTLHLSDETGFALALPSPAGTQADLALIGEKAIAHRQGTGTTRAALAHSLGISENAIQRSEAPDATTLTTSFLRYLHGLGISWSVSGAAAKGTGRKLRKAVPADGA